MLIYEVANVLRYKNHLSAEDVRRSVQDIYDLDINIIPVTADLVASAIRLARQYDLSVYDASFVACADHAGAPLITADDALFRKMRAYPSVMHLANIAASEP